jgi:hypothetical protein
VAAESYERPLLVVGSMYLVGALRPSIVNSDKALWRVGAAQSLPSSVPGGTRTTNNQSSSFGDLQ